MDDIGFGGTASRYNSRFGSGSDITAKQLNDLANGIQATTPMPYLGAGQSVSFVPGGSLITQIPRATNFEGDPLPRQQFECWAETMTTGEGESVETFSVLKIMSGAVNFTQSNMPEIQTGFINNTQQVWIRNAAVYPASTRHTGVNDPADVYVFENDGYFKLEAAGIYYVILCKADISSGIEGISPEGGLLYETTPWVAIVKKDSEAYTQMFIDSGPSQYINFFNVQKMTGYNESNSTEDKDWGYCHTGYFNPTKFGYALKVIATVRVGLLSPEQFDVDQECVGSLDISIQGHYHGATLRSRAGMDEADDPYYVNETPSPGETSGWNDVVNFLDMTRIGVGGFSGSDLELDWYDEVFNDYTPRSVSTSAYSYYEANGCGTECEHPLQVHFNSDGDWTVCLGTINNVEVTNLEGTDSGGTGTIYFYVQIGNETVDGNVRYPATTGTGVPTIITSASGTISDTDGYGHILIASVEVTEEGGIKRYVVNQMVKGSLWSERHKFTEPNTAMYYFYRL